MGRLVDACRPRARSCSRTRTGPSRTSSILQQVTEGTTTDQVLAALQSDGQGPPPPFFLQAGLETASLNPGNSP